MRSRHKWELEHYVEVQILTGNENLGAKQSVFRLVDSLECDVGETPEHVRWGCRRIEEERTQLLGEHDVEGATLGLRKVMEDGCRRVKLFQKMKRDVRLVEMVEQKEL